MWHKYFVYFLVKKDFHCFKIGLSRRINKRIVQLKYYGPFDINKSKLLTLNSNEDMKSWESDLKKRFKKYNLQISKTNNYNNGETEWYDLDYFNRIINYVQDKFIDEFYANEQILDVAFNQKIIDLLQVKHFKQVEYSKKVQFALLQYKYKKNNNLVFNRIMGKFKHLNIIGIDEKKNCSKIEYSILCDKSKQVNTILQDSNLKIITEKNYISRTFCTSTIENNDYICFKFSFDYKSIFNEHWISKYIIKGFKNFFKHHSMHKSIPKEFNELINKKFDPETSKVYFTGNPLIDNFIFIYRGNPDRFLVHNINDELLYHIFNDLMKFIEKEEEPKSYIIMIILVIFVNQQYKDKYIYEDEDLSLKFKPQELSEAISMYYIWFNLEIMKRNNVIESYTLPTIDNIFSENEDINIKVSEDYLLDVIMGKIFNSDKV